MINAQALGYAILFKLIITILAISSFIYIVIFTIKCFNNPEYWALVKTKPWINGIKLSVMLIIIGITIMQYIHSAQVNKKILQEIAVEQAILHPLLEKETLMSGFLLPKGTQVESYNPKYDSFISVSFPEFFDFKGLSITYLENPDARGAKVKLHKPTIIEGFECASNIKFGLYFDDNNLWINDCVLESDHTYKNIKWAKGTLVTTSKKDIKFNGQAQFELEGKAYNQSLNYTHNLIKNTETYKDEKYITFFTTKPGVKTVKDENGEYSMQFKGLMKSVHYRITNRDTGEVYLGKPDENGRSEKIITQEPNTLDFEYVFTKAK